MGRTALPRLVIFVREGVSRGRVDAIACYGRRSAACLAR
jgi:hypothetical protein